VRALRIYEGTSEIQRLVIAGEVLKMLRAQPEAS
jgi:alkylation response protein AidB-like acyl-CoA dehydrogenase